MTTIQPIEAVEQLYPVRVERTALREDSGGPGQWRGGLGLTREVRIKATGTRLSVLAEKSVLPPFGVCGGGPGATNHFWVRRNGRPIEPSPLPGKVSAFPIEPDDVLVMDSSGGGGFGDPLRRDPAAVAADLAQGYVTPAAAQAIYGVVLRAGAIDGKATARRRARLSAARPRVRLSAAPDLDSERGRWLRLDAVTAKRLGVGAGAVVELINPVGAPLRAWVAGVLPGDGGRAEVPAVVLRMLALAEDAVVDIRPVHTALRPRCRRRGRIAALWIGRLSWRRFRRPAKQAADPTPAPPANDRERHLARRRCLRASSARNSTNRSAIPPSPLHRRTRRPRPVAPRIDTATSRLDGRSSR